MHELSPGWQTDLAIFQLEGSSVEEFEDHLIVRSPHNPTFHWGNCLVVTDATAADDAPRWMAAFGAAHPSADWIAVGFTQMPTVTQAWTAAGVELELDDVLSTRTPPRAVPCPDGYSVRRIFGDDWERLIVRNLAENERSGEHEPRRHEQFVRRRAASHRTLCDRGLAAFFGAFCGADLVADLGIVRCGETARYQNVETEPAHQRRGLASHLLGVAATWARNGGCDRWVIVTEATNAAGRVYRSVGFEPDVPTARAYRRPPV